MRIPHTDWEEIQYLQKHISDIGLLSKIQCGAKVGLQLFTWKIIQ